MGMKFDSKPGQEVNNIFVDGSDAYANKKKAWITFRYPFGDIGRAVVFKAFVTSFSDTFSPSFDEDQVYGRTDPIKTYMGTKRSISLGFDVVAASDEEAIGNLEKVQKLAQFMYPTYDTAGDASTIAGPPIIRLGFMNMITSQGASVNSKSVSIENDVSGSYTATYNNHPESKSEYGIEGLPGTISSVTYDFNLQNNVNNVTVGTGAIFSKIISVSIGFEPLHEHTIDGATISENTNFPYGVNLEPKNLTDPGLQKKLIVGDGEDIYGGGLPPRVGKGNYLSDARDAFIARVEAKQARSIDSEKIQSGIEFLNDTTQENRTKLRKQKESQQQQDMANARYNSLFGRSRLKRDIRKGPDGRKSELVGSYFDDSNEDIRPDRVDLKPKDISNY